MKPESPPRGTRYVALASCFVLGLVALLVWRVAVWQRAAKAVERADAAAKPSASERATEHGRSDATRGLPPSRVAPTVWHPPSDEPTRRTPRVREPQHAANPDDLDALAISDPERARALAREALTSDPNSELAPRYARSLVKALTSLGRFHEARAEARRMVERYRGTSEALDVERHLLVYPLDQPSREQMQAEAGRGVPRQRIGQPSFAAAE